MLGPLLASIERAWAIDPAAGSSFSDAEHVVILMQENRSFDHVFGTLRGVRGFNDPRAVTLPDGKPVWLQSNAAGETYGPFRLDIKNTKATWLGGLPHSWRDQQDARAFGNHDGWLDAKKSSHKEYAAMPFTMGYYEREDLPFYYALADAFTICDQHFCSSLTGTTPNRLHLWTGTIREKPEFASAPKVRNADVDYGSTVSWKTFPERLEEAGVSWRVYQNELSVASGLEGESDAWLQNFTDNPLEWFDQYHVELRKTRQDFVDRMVVQLPGEIAALQTAEKAQRASFDRISAHERTLHEKAFTTNEGDPAYRELGTLRYRNQGKTEEMAVPKGDPFYRFRTDVREGKLPTVSWLVPSERFSDHPGSPWYGAWFLAEALNILTHNPEVWRKTIFILTYDENDGYFDHVPPFVAPDPRDAESGKVSDGIDTGVEYQTLDQDLQKHRANEARGGPVGLGFRVPLIVASPWSRGGYVCSQVFDHTSVLQLLERVTSKRAGKEIRETNISAWRRTVCGDLSATFRAAPANAPALRFPARDAFFEQVRRAQFAQMPSGYRKIGAEDAAKFEAPRQERGVRPSTALGYELVAEGRLSDDKSRFEISLEARAAFLAQALGSPFHIYTPGQFLGQAKLRTRSYAVASGQRVNDAWTMDGFSDGRYHLRVHGPNGFLREFAGTADDPRVEISCEYLKPGDVELRVANRSEKASTVQVKDFGFAGTDRTITVAAGESQSVAMALARSFHWYDFAVTVAGVHRYLRRFAGRVETGKDGFSDPVMGG
jgi:phospholipase C